MQSCETVDAMLPLYVSGRLGVTDRKHLAAHLATCGSCREELGRLFRLRSQVEAVAARHAPSADQLDRVFANLAADAGFAASSPAPSSARLDRYAWLDPNRGLPLAQYLRPILWTQRIIEAAERLCTHQWAIQVGSIVLAPRS